jgi:hypothetical protein
MKGPHCKICNTEHWLRDGHNLPGKVTVKPEHKEKVLKQAARPVRKIVKPAPAKAAAAIVIPPIKKGELWSGIMLKENGKPDYHLIKLPGQADKTNYAGSLAYAKKQGGEAPTLRDLALMRTNLRKQFQDKWYWSSEESRSSSGWAWMQNFANGSQLSYFKVIEICAVAVRRVLIS